VSVTVLGISCYYHDSAAALIRDGEVIAAVQEERFDRARYSPAFPLQSVNYCLQQAGITILDVDEVAFYEKMYLKFQRTVIGHLCGYPFTLRNFMDTMPLWLKDRLAVSYEVEEQLTYKKPVLHVKHHLSHAGAAFLVSPFERAAILTVDGVGEYATAAWGVGNGTDIEVRKELQYPHSIGLLYSIVTAFLGFRVFTGEGKVMALAEFGAPTYMEHFEKLVHIAPDGSFRLDTSYFSYNRGEKMHNQKFEALFGAARDFGAPLEQRHKDIACSLQRTTEEVVLRMARHLHAATGEKKLCLAGGVSLNVTANTRIRNETPFEEVFIQPAAGDAGSALGAAAVVYHSMLGHPRTQVMHSCALGPSYLARKIDVALRNAKANFRKLEQAELIEEVAGRLAEGQIVGWFSGRMEYGPRALGNRSILADPSRPGMKDEINARIKNRESFRPFGASILADQVGEWFDFQGESPFMLLVADVLAEKRSAIPAVIHCNGTSRIQTVTEEHNGRYHDLITRFFEKTGVPMLLNTSLNKQEPIVNTPDEAYATFVRTGMDCLVIDDYLVERPST
jgi:carbamoyltransferase